jgi:hypothetical protein
VLTERDGRLAVPRVVPEHKWRWGREVDGKSRADRTYVYMAEGFQAGKIYELVYWAQAPTVAGLGLQEHRDWIGATK